MRRLLTTLTLFAVAAGVNTASVAVQLRWAYLTRRFGARGWYLHLAVVVPPWACLLALLPGLGRHVRWPLPATVRPLGVPVLFGAGALWLAAFRRLGGTRTGNGNLFGHGSQEQVSGGIFRLLRNPMYDSYVLALVGAALHGANAAYLLVAAEAVVLFRIEAWVENQPFRTRAGAHTARGRARRRTS